MRVLSIVEPIDVRRGHGRRGRVSSMRVERRIGSSRHGKARNRPGISRGRATCDPLRRCGSLDARVHVELFQSGLELVLGIEIVRHVVQILSFSRVASFAKRPAASKLSAANSSDLVTTYPDLARTSLMK